MKIRCGCGKTLQIPDDAGGKKVRCPVCDAVTVAPAAPEPPPEPALFMAEAVEDDDPPPPPRAKSKLKPKKEVATDDEKTKKPWKKHDDKPAQPPIPAWAWVFVVACGAIPVVALGGAIPMAIGFGGGGGCIALSRDADKSIGTRVGGCVGITALCWGLFALLIGGILALGD